MLPAMILISWFNLLSPLNVCRRITHTHMPLLHSWLLGQSSEPSVVSAERQVKVSPWVSPPPRPPSCSLHFHTATVSFCNLLPTQPFISTAGGVKSSSTFAFSLSHSASGRRKSHYSYTCGKNRPFILIATVNTDQQGYWSFLRMSEVDSFWKDVEFIFWLWGRRKSSITLSII